MMQGGRNPEAKNMHNIFRIPVLAVLLIMAAGVCAVSAVNLNVGDVSLPDTVGTGDITLAFDSSVPGGMAGYKLTFTVAETAKAKIVGVKYPAWSDPNFRSSSVSADGKTGTLKVVNVTGTGTSSLGSVTVQGLTFGSMTTLAVTVDELDDLKGNLVSVAGASGDISVAQEPGTLMVNATPSVASYGAVNAWIFIDGVNKGVKTNTTISNVPAGERTVRLNLTGYVDAEKKVNVASGTTTKVEFRMDKPGTLIVRCTNVTGAAITTSVVPANNDILINGLPTGTTPATFTGMPPGSWTVRLDATGYLGYPITKSLASGGSQIFSFTLSPARNDIPGNTAPYGSIQIDSVGTDGTPIEGATVILDGETKPDLQTSTTPDVDVGTHSVTVSLDGYLTPAPVLATVAPHTKTVLPPFVLKPGVPATIRILPRTMNIGRGEGKFIAFVRLPEGYKAADVDPRSVFCNGAQANRLIRTKAFPQILGAVFTRKNLVDVLPGDHVPFVVSGTIKTKGGDTGFSGIDYIRVIKLSSKAKEDTDDIDKLNDDTIMKNMVPKDL